MGPWSVTFDCELKKCSKTTIIQKNIKYWVHPLVLRDLFSLQMFQN